MHRFTTPTIPITVEGADLTHCRVWVTLSQGRLRRITREITDIKQLMDVETRKEWGFIVRLTQDESSKFREDRPIDVQVNLMDQNGFRGVTDVGQTPFTGTNLMDRRV